MKALVFLALPLSLNVYAHLQCISLYYYKDPLDDPHHPVDPIPKKRPTDQQENFPYQSTYIFYMKYLWLKHNKSAAFKPLFLVGVIGG